MHRIVSRFVVVASALALMGLTLGAARAEDDAQERAELAKALTSVPATLQQGLILAQTDGTPISSKFEVEHGKLQLSIYTMKGNAFSEVVVNPNTGKVDKAETITDKEDLDHAAAQKAAMDKAKVTLLAAANNAVTSNGGYRVVSIYPALNAGHPVAEITLVRGDSYKTVNEKLD